MTVKIRVLGKHLPSRGAPWAYHAEVYDEADPAKPMWTCAHDHESPQLAHGCAANWLDAPDKGPATYRKPQTA